MAMRLYDLTEQYNDLADMLEQQPDNEALQAMLDGLGGKFADKCESIIKLVRSKQAEQEVIDNEIKRLKSRSDKLNKDSEWLLSYVEREMRNANLTEIKSSLFSIKLGMNPPSVNVTDEFKIPQQYMRAVPATFTPDKVAIKEAISRGENVPGCEIRQDLKLKVR